MDKTCPQNQPIYMVFFGKEKEAKKRAIHEAGWSTINIQYYYPLAQSGQSTWLASHPFSSHLPCYSPSPSSTHLLPRCYCLPQTSSQWPQPASGCCSVLPLLSTTPSPSQAGAAILPPLHVLLCTTSQGTFFSAALHHRAPRLLWWPRSKRNQSLLLRKKDLSLHFLATKMTPTSGIFFHFFSSPSSVFRLWRSAVMKIILCCIYTLYFFSPSSSGSMV